MLKCFNKAINYNKIKDKEILLILDKNHNILSKKTGGKDSVELSDLVLKKVSKGKKVDILHTHPDEGVHSGYDIFALLKNKEVKKSCVIFPSKKYECLSKTRKTALPSVYGHNSEGIIKELQLYKNQEESIKAFAEVHNLKLKRGRCKED